MPSTLQRAREIAAADRSDPSWVPEPPVELPPGRVVHVPGRGEVFVATPAATGRWSCCCTAGCVSADINWFTA